MLSGTDLASLTEQLHIDADVALVDAAENFRATKRRCRLRPADASGCGPGGGA